MLVSAIILVATFAALFTEGLHHIHRTRVAMAGAGAMVIAGQITGFYNPELALEAIDWNVVLLLGAMMTVVAIMAPTGGFEAMAYSIANFSKGRLFLLMALMGTAITLISMLLDNVTTVVIFGPLIVLICQALKVTPVPFLLAAAMLSNAGGVATLVGDPPNLMIGSAAGIDFNTFFYHMGGIVFCIWLGTLALMRLVFNDTFSKPSKGKGVSVKPVIKDKRTWNIALVVMVLMIGLFIMHGKLHWEAWVVAAFGLAVLLLFTKDTNPDDYFVEIELSLLMFFVALFVIVGGVEHSNFLKMIAQNIQPFVEKDLLLATIVLLWVSAILSAAIDNIPFTAAMIPIILGMEAQGIHVTPLWWALSVGVGIGGNGTHIGATANVFVVSLSERIAKEKGDPSLAITPGLWFRKGTPIVIATLLIATVIMVVFFDFYNGKLHG
ncbi:MAG TPA: arsenic transporter [Rhodospirillaceae bacterium]|nr:arsenic transporter [Rhodospirillaceae bacterium]